MPAATLGFVDDVAVTMAVPLRRFVMWHDPVRELKGALGRSRDRMEAALRDGYGGGPIETLGVFSYVYGGSNHHPSSEIWFSPRWDDAEIHAAPVVEVRCLRALNDGDDVSALATTWQRMADAHLRPSESFAPREIARPPQG